MRTTKLIFGLLNTSAQFPSAQSAIRARDLTIAWSRFKYSGPMIEADSLDDILQQAASTDASHCLVQCYGHILTEVWRPESGEIPEIMEAIDAWIGTRKVFITGRMLPDNENGLGLADDFILIDLQDYRDLDCPKAGPPPWRALAAEAQKEGLTIEETPESIAASLVRLDPATPGKWTPPPEADVPSSPDTSTAEKTQGTGEGEQVTGEETQGNGEQTQGGSQDDFLENIHSLTSQLRKGIFVWNLESYADIETPAEHFHPPLKNLYTVSAGFKPNRILETHGFDAHTRMVVFDYSAQGLEFRRLIHEEWNGVDYPGFLRILMKKIPSGDAFYLLWDGMTPENLDWNLVKRRWQEELQTWGGEEALYDHWQKFRRLNIEYVHCDILTEHDRLLKQINAQDNSLVWWSNAFFSVHSNWLYSTEQRVDYYRQWIGKVSEKAPELLLYGSDCHNVSVNCYSASRYRDWFELALKESEGGLKPASLHRHEIRF